MVEHIQQTHQPLSGEFDHPAGVVLATVCPSCYGIHSNWAIVHLAKCQDSLGDDIRMCLSGDFLECLKTSDAQISGDLQERDMSDRASELT